MKNKVVYLIIIYFFFLSGICIGQEIAEELTITFKSKNTKISKKSKLELNQFRALHQNDSTMILKVGCHLVCYGKWYKVTTKRGWNIIDFLAGNGGGDSTQKCNEQVPFIFDQTSFVPINSVLVRWEKVDTTRALPHPGYSRQ